MIDVNKPVTNPSLVESLKNMNESNVKEKQDIVIDEVMKAHFITPVTISPSPLSSGDNNEVVLKENTTINFNIIENTNNQKFFLAFTDWDELRKWHNNETQQTLIITFDDLAAMILDEKGDSDGFVINPFGHNLIFNKSMILYLKNEKERRKNGGVVEHIVEKDTPVQLGQPRVYPIEMINAISDFLKKQKNVKAAYLQLMIKEGEQSYLVVVDFEGDRRKLFDGIGSVAMKHLNGMYIDLIPFDSEFGRKACSNVEPFYTRKRFGFFK